MDYGIDLMIISPTDSHELTPVVREAYSKIPVIVLDRAVEGYDYSLFIGPDNERLGREAGGVISELLGRSQGHRTGDPGRSGSPPTLARSQGLRDVLAKQPNIKIVDTIVADWLRDTAEDKVAERMRVIPGIDVIFAQNDAMAFGAWRATQSRWASRASNLSASMGFPARPAASSSFEKGVLSATFTCPTGGKESVIYGRDILLHKEGIPKKIFLRPRKVTPETLLEQAEGATIADIAAVLQARRRSSSASRRSAPRANGASPIPNPSRRRRPRRASTCSSRTGSSTRRTRSPRSAPLSAEGRRHRLLARRRVGLGRGAQGGQGRGHPGDHHGPLRRPKGRLALAQLHGLRLHGGRAAGRALARREHEDEGAQSISSSSKERSAPLRPSRGRSASLRCSKTIRTIKIIASESGDFFRGQGYEVMKKILARRASEDRRALRA